MVRERQFENEMFFCLTGFDISINIKYVIANYSRKTTSVNFKELAITTVVVNFFYLVRCVFRKESLNMSIPIFTKVKVVQKFTNDRKKDDGSTVTYYNIKAVDTVSYDSQIIGVSEDIYNKAEEGKDISLIGKCGGLGNKRYWYFNSVKE